MGIKLSKLPKLKMGDLSDREALLLQLVRERQERIGELEDEIARLKSEKEKPKIQPSRSRLEPKKKAAQADEDEQATSGQENSDSSKKKKRAGSAKRKKTAKLPIHETKVIEVLRRLNRRKAELLLVLERPDLPLHNNTSEQDIREFVTKRKSNGSTRSESGRRCRDTFASLKKTCRKLGVSFWEYLKDRVSGKNLIPTLGVLIAQKALLSQATLAENISLS